MVEPKVDWSDEAGAIHVEKSNKGNTHLAQ